MQETLVDNNWAEIADHIETIEELYEVGARRSGQRARLHVSLPLSSLA
jgi:hypothetical protein